MTKDTGVLSGEELAARLTGDILDAVPDDNDMQYILEMAAAALRRTQVARPRVMLGGEGCYCDPTDYEPVSGHGGSCPLALSGPQSEPPEPDWEYGTALRTPNGTLWDEEPDDSREAAEVHANACECANDHGPDVCVVVRRERGNSPGQWAEVVTEAVVRR